MKERVGVKPTRALGCALREHSRFNNSLFCVSSRH